MTAGSTLQGSLLKANREYRKTNLIRGKYKKKWVELTVDTLVYASSQQELLTGKIQVFSVHELLWVCAEGKAKFKVKFPERALLFKVESGSSVERDNWVAALEAAKQAKSRSTQQALGAEKLEQLQKTAEQQLLDPQNEGNPRRHRPGSLPGKREIMAAAAAVQQDTAEGLLPLTLPATCSPALDLQPPSPRSLLASAKTGQAFVSHSSESGHVQSIHHTDNWGNSRPRQLVSEGHIRDMQPAHISNFRYADPHDSNDGVDGGSDDGVLDYHSVQQHCASVPRPEVPPCNMNTTCRQQNSNSKCVDPPVQECSGSESPRTSLKRANLARRVTPGVLLITPRSPSAQQTPASEGQPAASATSSTCGNAGTAAEQLLLKQPDNSNSARPAVDGQGNLREQHASANRLSSEPSTVMHGAIAAVQQSGQDCQGMLPAVDDHYDEQILTLDPCELLTQQCGAPPSSVAGHHSLQGSLSSTPAGLAQGPRPGSAQYRPGAPLKSCLRQSGSASQLALLLGSASAPSSSAAVMAAAADDAEAAGGLRDSSDTSSNSSRRCPSSPLGKQPSPANNQNPHKSLGPDHRDWLQDNWDDDSSSCSGSDDDNDGNFKVTAVVTGETTLSGSAQLTDKHSTDAVLQVAGRGAVHGVRADDNWLADDFDDD